MAKAKRRRCEFCGGPLPKDARANQRYCSTDCRNGKQPEQVEQTMGEVARATEEAIAAAQDQLTAKDSGALAALRFLARKIDTEAELRELALQWAADNGGKPPPVDNVSVPTYLKYCEALGLTVASRAALEAKKAGDSGGGNQGGGSLSGIRGAVPRPA